MGYFQGGSVDPSRKFGELNHYLTQLLTRHGCFRAYQHGFRLKDDPSCPTGRLVHKDVGHVFCLYPRFADELETLYAFPLQQLTPETTTKEMLAMETSQNTVIDNARAQQRLLKISICARRKKTQTHTHTQIHKKHTKTHTYTLPSPIKIA